METKKSCLPELMKQGEKKAGKPLKTSLSWQPRNMGQLFFKNFNEILIEKSHFNKKPFYHYPISVQNASVRDNRIALNLNGMATLKVAFSIIYNARKHAKSKQL